MSTSREQTVAAPADFLTAYPDYETTGALDLLRSTEYRYLDDGGVVYLDFAGAGLAATAQHRAHEARLAGQCFGNPHSENPTSRAATDSVEQARRAVLAHLNADPAEYCAIFTANASAACRLVGEAYPFTRGARYVVAADNHNSVIGIREFARARGGRVVYAPIDTPDLRTTDEAVDAALGSRRITTTGRRGLFAYPAQSNFTGVQHPLDWVELAQRRGYDVLLDAAAYLPANALDLSVVKPDFVPISWYKLFGYPTGIGCLVARRSALARLRRPWFAGGTIAAASLQGNWHVAADDESAFEDGTLNFLSIPDVTFGLDWLREIGLDTVRRRVTCLTGRLLDRLSSLRHDNGAPMIRIYGPVDTARRGGTVTFNFLDPDGVVIDERLIAAESAAAGISLRTGCFCNPGAGEAAFGISLPVLSRLFRTRMATMDEYIAALGLPSGGAIRVSFGPVSDFADLQYFLRFAENTYRNRPATQQGLRPRERC
ncbi:aminotransferase class V-fold PLP-dependent enzyme [Nocardia flavorosea]|uniref:Aminotransferase class V-fold PLP-dependent enzyme n=1 Tax=Nocardia flavorosea TaxID=53429 RepID=A0A846YP01_9NOCA|nr:aminotransferase class V-fold PLP-dependent enzyme [Nocardia flavorosea]NKY59038.1 aminotransferase class V-fold PLP-dependent enzyme [Nocardia flavorosea]